MSARGALRATAMAARRSAARTRLMSHAPTRMDLKIIGAPPRRMMTAVIVAVIACLSVATYAAAESSPKNASEAAHQTVLISRGRVGPIHLGRSHTSLHRRRLVGRLRAGCPLGPKEFGAALRLPLRGAVTFNTRRHAITIFITRGAATARGIGIGATEQDVLDAYPDATYQVRASPDDPIPISFITVGKPKPWLTIDVDATTHTVTGFGVPYTPVCE